MVSLRFNISNTHTANNIKILHEFSNRIIELGFSLEEDPQFCTWKYRIVGLNVEDVKILGDRVKEIFEEYSGKIWTSGSISAFALFED